MTAPIYAVGDIHGHLDKLDAALDRITRDGGADAKVVFLGDLVDRGPDSRGVIDRLMTGLQEGRDWTVLRGNHDRMMSYWLSDDIKPDPQLLLGYHWLDDRIGGLDTLASYDVTVPDGARYYQVHPEAQQAVPTAHREFLDGLPYHHLHGDLLFVHAGVRPGLALADQSNDDLCWIRREFLDHSDPHPWLVVHGHTHRPAPEHRGNRVNLDSGAGHGRALTAAVFEGRDCWVLDEDGRRVLQP